MSMDPAKRFARIRQEIPEDVSIVVAAKTRSPDEISSVIEAGAKDIGENYVQEGLAAVDALGEQARAVRWHMIGHLQKNKINKALPIFDVIQTVDSVGKAKAIDKRVEASGKNVVPILIEINIGSEDAKAGIEPEGHEPFEEYIAAVIHDMAMLEHIRVAGLMTMGPRFGDPEDSRPYFRRMARIFRELKTDGSPNVDMCYLSMGMTNSYRVAIEEGSNMVRIGTAIFGARQTDQ